MSRKINDIRINIVSQLFGILIIGVACTAADGTVKIPIRERPIITDANWISMGVEPTTEEYVDAVVCFKGKMVIGGSFTELGGETVSYIAVWNGDRWSALGTGLDKRVLSLAVIEDTLYAGGYFTIAGGCKTQGVACWDGEKWSVLGNGLDGEVHAMAVIGRDLYVGGAFSCAGGLKARRIAKWDGYKWTALGNGMGMGDHEGDDHGYGDYGNYVEVDSLVVMGKDLYAGGLFLTAGDVKANRIAKWNGSVWSALGDGLGGDEYAHVQSLAIGGTYLYAGGGFTVTGESKANHIAKWDGKCWSAMDMGMEDMGIDNRVDAITSIGGEVFMLSEFWKETGEPRRATSKVGNKWCKSVREVAKWDGNKWSALVTGEGPSECWQRILSLAAINEKRAGENDNANEKVATKNNLALDSRAWTVSRTGMSGPIYTTVELAGKIYVGGDFSFAGGVVPANNIAMWDGKRWSSLGKGVNGTVSSLLVVGNDLYVGGHFSQAGEVMSNNVAKWNGVSWSSFDSGTNGKSVKAMIYMDGKLFVGGNFTSVGGITVNNIAMWDGINWSALSSGVSGSTLITCDRKELTNVYALAAWDGNLYIGGNFTNASGLDVNGIAKWDGKSWAALGKGVGITEGSGRPREVAIYSMAAFNKDLFVGGRFDTAGGVIVNNIAKWNGSTWSELGTGILKGECGHTFVRTLIISGDYLFAGGEFTIAGGVVSRCIARWDGSLWSALGSGTNDTIYSLITLDRYLYAGGGFTKAGGKASAFFAKATF